MSRRRTHLIFIASVSCTVVATLIFSGLLFAHQDGLPGLIVSGMVLSLLLIAFAVTCRVNDRG